MDAKYGNEVSGLKMSRILGEFAFKHLRNFFKRIFYNYFLRDLPIASIELLLAIGLLGFGLVFGGWHWWLSSNTGMAASTGTVMIPSLALVFGMQLALAFLNYDVASVPRLPLHPRLDHRLPPAGKPQ